MKPAVVRGAGRMTDFDIAVYVVAAIVWALNQRDRPETKHDVWQYVKLRMENTSKRTGRPWSKATVAKMRRGVEVVCERFGVSEL